MAKSARASSRKENNSKLRATTFGPHENLRVERLSSKLLALAAQSKPGKSSANNSKANGITNDTKALNVEFKNHTDEMVLDTELPKSLAQHKSSRRHRVRKRSINRKTAISFPKYNKKKF